MRGFSRRARTRAIVLSAAVLALAALPALVLAELGEFLVLCPVREPDDPATRAIEEGELSAHVHFLADRHLKGRRPMTMGSWLARRYIGKRFEACGLRPWETGGSFEQPYVLGTNVIAVLPGSDPALAHEIVLVCAHYDHLGGKRVGPATMPRVWRPCSRSPNT